MLRNSNQHLGTMGAQWLSHVRLCDFMDCSLPGSSVSGISQARILEGVAIFCSRGSSQPRGRTCVSCISCFSRWILYHPATWGSPLGTMLGAILNRKITNKKHKNIKNEALSRGPPKILLYSMRNEIRQRITLFDFSSGHVQ